MQPLQHGVHAFVELRISIACVGGLGVCVPCGGWMAGRVSFFFFPPPATLVLDILLLKEVGLPAPVPHPLPLVPGPRPHQDAASIPVDSVVQALGHLPALVASARWSSAHYALRLVMGACEGAVVCRCPPASLPGLLASLLRRWE